MESMSNIYKYEDTVLVRKVNKERKHISGKKQFYIIKSILTWDKIAGLFQNEKRGVHTQQA